MFEMFTQPARAAILEAQAEARGRHDPHLGCEHLLVGLLRAGTGLASAILVERSITLDAVRAAVDELLGPAPTPVPVDEALASIGIDLGQVRARLEATFGPDALAEQPVPFDPAVKEALQAAVTEARLLHQRYVGTEHELLGLLQVTEGAAAKILQQLGVDLADLSIEVRRRAAPEEQRVQALLAQWQSLYRTLTDAPEGRRKDVLAVLEGVAANVHQATRQESEDGLAATRQLGDRLDTLLRDARAELNAIRSA